jgi:hypothetical protein
VAAALGSFLQSLMGALHAQNSDGADAPPPPPYGEQQGGPGKLESDLQSLISELSHGGSLAATAAMRSISWKALSPTCWTSWASAATAQTAPAAPHAATKLAAFLQALSSKVGGNGTSGNLVNTTV